MHLTYTLVQLCTIIADIPLGKYIVVTTIHAKGCYYSCVISSLGFFLDIAYYLMCLLSKWAQLLQ